MDTIGERQRNETKSKEKEERLKEIWCGGDGEGTDAVFLNGDEDNEYLWLFNYPKIRGMAKCCFLNRSIFWLFHEKDPQKYEGPLMNEPSFL